MTTGIESHAYAVKISFNWITISHRSTAFVRCTNLAKEFCSIQHALRDFNNLHAFIHGCLAQLGIGSGLAQVLALHQQAFGALNDFAVV